jgi:hypothetical protein
MERFVGQGVPLTEQLLVSKLRGHVRLRWQSHVETPEDSR